MSDPVLWVRLLDSAAGLFMWLFVLQAAVSLFLADNSRFKPLLVLQRVTNPLLSLSLYVTPDFVIPRLNPLVAAFWLFIIRFYCLPTALGYDVFTFSDMPLEHLVGRIITAIMG